jgi:RNA polymerase sigma factor (sigma-70 family)
MVASAPRLPTFPPQARCGRHLRRKAIERNGDSWGELMSAAQAGNGGAYRRLLSEVQPWLQRFFDHRVPRWLVDDLIQETLLAIHRKRHTYDPRRPFQPWLAVIARHKWIDWLRRGAARIEEELPLDLAVEGHERAVMSSALLGHLLDGLKPAQQDAIRLVKLEGLTIAEASARTGQSIPLVKVNIHRGLARLAAMVEEDSGGE